MGVSWRATAVRVAVLAVFVLPAAGCLFDVKKDAREDLLDAVRDFNEGVHWGNLELAGKRVAPERRAAWLERAERVAKEVSYSSYDIRRVEITEKDKAAAVRVELGWFHRSALIEKRTTLLERWSRRKGVWVLSALEVVDGPPVGG